MLVNRGTAMAQTGEQIAMLMDCVRREFPGRDVWDGRDHDRSARTVSVRTDAGILLLTASFESLSDHSRSQVQERLEKWQVGNAPRQEAGATKRLLVTRDGWKVTSR